MSGTDRTIYMCLLIVAIFAGGPSAAQTGGQLDGSMFTKKSGEYITNLETTESDLYRKMGHHGPAIENEWVAYRLYFNDLASVDIFSKFRPGLELKACKWYPDKAQKADGYGSDNYLVRETIGLGGLRLWDGTAVRELGPVERRTANLIVNDTMARISMLSEGIAWMGEKISVHMTVTTFAGSRHAVVEATVVSGREVSFVTGITVHPNLDLRLDTASLRSWGDHVGAGTPDVYNVGAALIYNPDDFRQALHREKEALLISHPTRALTYLITSSNDREASALNSLEAFDHYIRDLAGEFISR